MAGVCPDSARLPGARDAQPVPGGFAVPAVCKTPMYGGSPGRAGADRRLQRAYHPEKETALPDIRILAALRVEPRELTRWGDYRVVRLYGRRRL